MSVFLLLLTIVIDGIGLGVIFPVFTNLILKDSSQHLLSITSSITHREFVFGCLLCVYPLCMFLASSFLGSLSDIYGRKKVLVTCMLFNGLGFVVAYLSCYAASLSLLFLGRVISGLSAGNIPIAQAGIIDISSSDNKAKRLGYTSIANGVGYTLGPLIGSIFILKTSTAEYSALPFLITAFLCLINVALLAKFYNPDVSLVNKIAHKLNLFDAINNVISVIKLKKFYFFFISFFLYLLAYLGFYQYLSIYLNQKFGLSGKPVGYYITAYAVFFSISIFLLFPYLAKRFKIDKLQFISLLVQPLLILLYVFIDQLFISYCFLFIMAIAFSTCYVSSITMVSNRSAEGEQGKMLGIVASLTALAWGIIPLLSGIIDSLGYLAPIFFMLICSLLAIFARLKATQQLD